MSMKPGGCGGCGGEGGVTGALVGGWGGVEVVQRHRGSVEESNPRRRAATLRRMAEHGYHGGGAGTSARPPSSDLSRLKQVLPHLLSYQMKSLSHILC